MKGILVIKLVKYWIFSIEPLLSHLQNAVRWYNNSEDETRHVERAYGLLKIGGAGRIHVLI